MKVFKQDGKVRLQLMDMKKGEMLFDFQVEESLYNELKGHIIEHLNKFEV